MPTAESDAYTISASFLAVYWTANWRADLRVEGGKMGPTD